MRKTFRWLIMPVMACGLAIAQSDMSNGKKIDDHDHMNGKTKTVTGCVEQKDGNYYLVNKKHRDGIQLTSSEDLQSHVGHKVSVTGTMSGKDMETKGRYNSTSAEDPMGTDHQSGEQAERRDKGDHHGMRMMSVNSMSMVSDTCKMKK